MQQETKPKPSPAQFLREVRQEISKVTWPTRRETMISTIMVIVMVIVTALFFLVVDSVIAWGVEKILNVRG